MCLACVQSRRSLKDPWPVCLGVFFVSVFEQRAHVKAQTTRLAHDLDQISVVLQMWRRIVALRYIQLQMMSVYFSLYFNTRNGEAHQQFFAKHSCACVAVVFTSYATPTTPIKPSHSPSHNQIVCHRPSRRHPLGCTIPQKKYQDAQPDLHNPSCIIPQIANSYQPGFPIP